MGAGASGWEQIMDAEDIPAAAAADGRPRPALEQEGMPSKDMKLIGHTDPYAYDGRDDDRGRHDYNRR